MTIVISQQLPQNNNLPLYLNGTLSLIIWRKKTSQEGEIIFLNQRFVCLSQADEL